MANVKDIRDFIEKCEATDATIYQMLKRLTRSLSYLRELLAEVERLERDAERYRKALVSVRRVLDGMDNWSNHDVRANAGCAFDTADDALRWTDSQNLDTAARGET